LKYVNIFVSNFNLLKNQYSEKRPFYNCISSGECPVQGRLSEEAFRYLKPSLKLIIQASASKYAATVRLSSFERPPFFLAGFLTDAAIVRG
jgi:hypothetical protein